MGSCFKVLSLPGTSTILNTETGTEVRTDDDMEGSVFSTSSLRERLPYKGACYSKLF